MPTLTERLPNVQNATHRQYPQLCPDLHSHSIINGMLKPLSQTDVYSVSGIFTVRFAVNHI
jgi:hypothetical protein